MLILDEDEFGKFASGQFLQLVHQLKICRHIPEVMKCVLSSWMGYV